MSSGRVTEKRGKNGEKTMKGLKRGNMLTETKTHLACIPDYIVWINLPECLLL